MFQTGTFRSFYTVPAHSEELLRVSQTERNLQGKVDEPLRNFLPVTQKKPFPNPPKLRITQMDVPILSDSLSRNHLIWPMDFFGVGV